MAISTDRSECAYLTTFRRTMSAFFMHCQHVHTRVTMSARRRPLTFIANVSRVFPVATR